METEGTTDEIKRLQRCINDLVSVLALPAIWTGHESSLVATTLLDVLVRVLRLDFAYLRVIDSADGLPKEWIRSIDGSHRGAQPHEIGRALEPYLTDDPTPTSLRIANPFAEDTISITVFHLGLQDRVGVFVIGSRRPDFPVETERLVLQVATNQAAIAFQEARYVSQQRRTAEDLERRVSERTAELTAVNEALRQEIVERKRAEEELRQSQAQFQAAIDTIPGLVWGALPDGHIDYFNQRWREYTGLTLREAGGWGWQVAIHPEDVAELVEDWRTLLASGKPGEMEARIRRFDGEYRWFLHRAAPLYDGAGKLVKWYGQTTDIDERKRAEDELRQSEARFQLAIDTIPGLVWTALPDGYIDYLNQRWREYTGLSLTEAGGWRWQVAIHPEDVAGLVEYWISVLASGKPGETEARLRRFDGEYRWFLFRGVPLYNAAGKLVKWYGQTTDIENLKRAENKIRDAERDLRITVQTIPTMTFSAFPDGSIDFVSKSWLDYTGFSEEEWLGGGWKKIAHPADLDRAAKRWQAALATGEPYECEVRTRTASGSYRWCLSRAVPLKNDSGKIVRWYGTNTDIEELKRAEEKLRQDEQELQTIVDAIPQGIHVMDPTGRVLYANKSSLEYTGLEIEDVRSENFRARLFHPDDFENINEERERLLGAGLAFEIEQRARRKDGQYRWLLMQYNPLRDEQGHVIRWYATATDIDDRKQTEAKIQNENLALREEIDRTSMFEEIVGCSEALRKVLLQVTKVAQADSTVLVLGETGTGKELIARAIHKRSRRSAGAFIRVNCAAIPSSLIASELFGHEKGAFTGALQRRLGRFEAADGGTIFLDEIGDLPIDTQIALLRVLQERELERVGSNQPISIDVRVVTATNRDLMAAVAAGTFRQDLFYRLNVFPIRIPSLRERADDIPLLVEYLIERYAKKAGKKIGRIEQKTLNLFQAYKWPGNIRELQNVVERAVILCDGGTFSVDETWFIQESPQDSVAPSLPIRGLLRLRENEEREMIEAALVESEGRVSGPSGAARRLGIPRQTLESKIANLGINKHRFKSA